MNITLETKNKSEEIIKAYLEENAGAILADKINNGVFIEKDGKRLLNRKSLASFMDYANQEAQKIVNKGERSACIDDTTVFGWAIHYFEEDSIEGILYNEDGTEFKKHIPQTPVKPTYTPTCAVKKPEPQMSMFDILNHEKDDAPTEEELDEAAQQTAIEIPEEKTLEEKPQPKGNPFYEKYKEIALKYSDGIVCYRLGDFYEVLGKKATTVANELELTLTGRDCGLEQRIPMVGFPYHCSDRYISKLVDRDYKVIVVESLEDIKQLQKEKVQPEIDAETGEILGDNDDGETLKNYHRGALLTLLELFGDDAIIG